MGHTYFLIAKKNLAMRFLVLAVFLCGPLWGTKEAASKEVASRQNAVKKSPPSTQPLPQWVHLSKSRVHGRAGPGANYPILYVYEAPMLPMKVLAYWEGFYKVQDYQGSKSWVHRTMVSQKMPAYLIKSDCLFYKEASDQQPFGILAKDVILRLKKCTKSRCFGYVRIYEGWFDHNSCKGWGGLPHA